MPQMNKGGKFVFGESEVHFDGWVQLPPQAVDETLVDRAYFISPIVDMENLICNMMQWSNVTEQELAEKTGKSFAEVAADTERNNYMSAQEALAYGLIDKIIDKR